MTAYLAKATQLPRGYWNHMSNQRAFLADLAKKLHISDYSDWYNVTTKVFQQHGASVLLKKYNTSPYQLLCAVYPQYLNLTQLRYSTTNI